MILRGLTQFFDPTSFRFLVFHRFKLGIVGQRASVRRVAVLKGLIIQEIKGLEKRSDFIDQVYLKTLNCENIAHDFFFASKDLH